MNEAEPKPAARSFRPRDEAPFCWFARAALDRIEQSPHISNQTRAKLVYLAGHVVEASRQGKPTYTAPRALIARHAGVSVRTLTEANAELEAAGLILIEHHFDSERKRHHPSTYTLCGFRRKGSGKVCPTPQAEHAADNQPAIKEHDTTLQKHS
ncbi:MAG: hypothetical protein AB9869_25940 [Verrucomicrobiia bacterium]